MDSNKLKGLRVEKRYTQEQISIKLGMATKTYNRKELGIVEFTRDEIQKLADTLDMSMQMVNEIFFQNKLTNRLIADDHTA